MDDCCTDLRGAIERIAWSKCKDLIDEKKAEINLTYGNNPYYIEAKEVCRKIKDLQKEIDELRNKLGEIYPKFKYIKDEESIPLILSGFTPVADEVIGMIHDLVAIEMAIPGNNPYMIINSIVNKAKEKLANIK